MADGEERSCQAIMAIPNQEQAVFVAVSITIFSGSAMAVICL